MKSKILIFIFIFVLAIALSSNIYAEEKPIKWVAQSAWGMQLPLTVYSLTMWAEKVEAMSGGRLLIKLHGAGEIVPGASVYEAVRDGILDCGANTPAFQKGLYPAGDLFYTLPGGVLSFNDLIVWMYGGGGMQLEQEMYDDEIIVFPLGLTPPETIWTTKLVDSLEGLKGLKIRSAGLAMELFDKLGMSVVLLGGGEVLPALQRGVIDATEFCSPSMDYALGLSDIAKFALGPPIHMSNNIFQLVINPKSWNELPDDLKEIVKNAAIAATFEGYALHWMDSIEAFKKIRDAGVKISKLSAEEQAEVRKLSFEILEEKSKKDPYFNKVWNAQKNFLELYKPLADFSKFD